MKRATLIPFLVFFVAAFSCAGQQGTKPETAEFDAASAYGFVKAQVEFGPRVPGTAAHTACADWFVKTLK